MPGSFNWFMKAKDITTCKQWAIFMFGFGLMVSIDPLSLHTEKKSQSQIEGTILMVGSVILWFMPKDIGDDKR
jgi:hypothetical protein